MSETKYAMDSSRKSEMEGCSAGASASDVRQGAPLNVELHLLEPLLAFQHGLVLFPVPRDHEVVVLHVDGLRLERQARLLHLTQRERQDISSA